MPERRIEHDRKFITVSELAHVLGVRPETVREYVKQKRLPSTRIGREILFDRERIERVLYSGYGGFLNLPHYDRQPFESMALLLILEAIVKAKSPQTVSEIGAACAGTVEALPLAMGVEYHSLLLALRDLVELVARVEPDGTAVVAFAPTDKGRGVLAKNERFLNRS